MYLHALIYLIDTAWAFAEPAFHPSPFETSVSNTTHDVDVGRNGRTFEPQTLQADIGDIVNFHFYPANHSIAESTFEKPCQPKNASGEKLPIFSGFVTTKHWVAPHMFSLRINRTDPIWLYCSQEMSNYCKAGQVMVINPSNDSQTSLEDYKEAAALTNDTKSPSQVYGGVFLHDSRYDETLQKLANQTGAATPTRTSMASRSMIKTLRIKFAHVFLLGGILLVTL